MENQHETGENIVSNETQQEENIVNEIVTDPQQWVKSKMTTSLSKEIQKLIIILAPGNVKNITQFISWLLEDYSRLQQVTNAYNENQDDLNKKLQDAYNATDEYILKFTNKETELIGLQEKHEILQTNFNSLLKSFNETPTPPAPPKNETGSSNLFEYLGL